MKERRRFSKAQEAQLEELLNLVISESSQIVARYQDVVESGAVPRALGEELKLRVQAEMKRQKSVNSSENSAS